MNFATRFKELRQEFELSKKECADLFNLSKPTITHYEKGSRIPKIDKLCEIADFFQVTLDYLCGHSDIRNQFEMELTHHKFKHLYDKTRAKSHLVELYHYMKDLNKEQTKLVHEFVSFIYNKKEPA